MKVFAFSVKMQLTFVTQREHCMKVHRNKVKFSHTRYRALDPELFPVYRQSTCRWL